MGELITDIKYTLVEEISSRIALEMAKTKYSVKNGNRFIVHSNEENKWMIKFTLKDCKFSFFLMIEGKQNECSFDLIVLKDKYERVASLVVEKLTDVNIGRLVSFFKCELVSFCEE